MSHWFLDRKRRERCGRHKLLVAQAVGAGAGAGQEICIIASRGDRWHDAGRVYLAMHLCLGVVIATGALGDTENSAHEHRRQCVVHGEQRCQTPEMSCATQDRSFPYRRHNRLL
jgi:hypothetical protein